MGEGGVERQMEVDCLYILSPFNELPFVPKISSFEAFQHDNRHFGN